MDVSQVFADHPFDTFTSARTSRMILAPAAGKGLKAGEQIGESGREQQRADQRVGESSGKQIGREEKAGESRGADRESRRKQGSR